MASEKNETGFHTVTPPPKKRSGGSPKLSREHCEAVFAALTEKAETDQPWLAHQDQFSTVHKATSRALLYRETIAKYRLVENVKQVTSMVYSVTRDPDTGEKQLDEKGNEIGPFVFALRLKDEKELAA